MATKETLEQRIGNEPDRQHKLLTIDGGGIRGVLALEVLAGLEKKLADAHGIPLDDFRLSDFFDYVGGTSTGAVVAACVSRGMKVSAILDFYNDAGRVMFDNRKWQKLKSFILHGTKYDATPLAMKLKKMFGPDTTLEQGHLETLFLAVTRNQTTDSPWPISSNPKAKYNNPKYPDCNLRLPLWRVVRASTAAPMIFQAETIQWDPNDASKKFMFVDGGVTPYNNPAWLLYRMASDPAYNLNWATGEDKLLVISVGTGTSAKGDGGVLTKEGSFARLKSNKTLIGSMIQGGMVDQDSNCRQVGRCVHGGVLDAEIGDMIPRTGPRDRGDPDGNRVPISDDLGRKFLYARYNVHLERKELDELDLQDIDVAKVQDLGSVDHIDDLRKIGKRIAEDINIEHFAAFIHRQSA